MTLAAQEGETPRSRVAFAQATNTLRVTNNEGQPLGGWWIMRVVEPGPTYGNLYHNRQCASYSCTSSAEAIDPQTISNQTLFKFAHPQRLGDQDAVPLMVARTALAFSSSENPQYTPMVISSNTFGQPVSDPKLIDGHYWLQSLDVRTLLLECSSSATLKPGLHFCFLP
ncbi:MAG: hypothetical protein R3F53_04270 [Gammaproteobacteria bacterium]